VTVATLCHPTEDDSLVLNILEMWCCMLFKTLQPHHMEEWLDAKLCSIDIRAGPLNVALPLDYGDHISSKVALELLKESDDQLAREYYTDVKKGRLRPRPSSARKSRKTDTTWRIDEVPKSRRTSTTNAINEQNMFTSNNLYRGLFIGAFGTVGLMITYRLLTQSSIRGSHVWR